MPDKSILVVGSLNMDQIVRVPRLPRLGETLLGAGSLRLAPGGKGANQAVAMARLGANVAMAGRVGDDPFGERLLRALQGDGVNTNLITVDQEEASGTAFIFLVPDGDNAIVVAAGANTRVGEDSSQFARINDALARSQALVMQLEIPIATVISLAAAGYHAGVPVVINLAPAQPLPEETLRQISLLVVNENEASLLSGQRVDTLEDARIVATILRERGIKQVAITLGAQGALLATGKDSDGSGGNGDNGGNGGTRTFYQSSPTVQVVDTTAAGDSFVGALTVALTEGQAPEAALKFAVYASALKVTKFGAQPGLPTRAEVEAFIRSSGA